MNTSLSNQKMIDLENMKEDELLELAKRVNVPMIVYEDRDDICPYLGTESDVTNIQGLSTWISKQTDILKIEDINTVIGELRKRLGEYFDWLIALTSEDIHYWDVYVKLYQPNYQNRR